MDRHDITFHDSGRKARNPPHPGYEEGIVFDMTGDAPRGCAVDLPWPAPGVGTWQVRCRTCGTSLALTAAGRIDDPRRLVLPCGRMPDARDVRCRPWTDVDEAAGTAS